MKSLFYLIILSLLITSCSKNNESLADIEYKVESNLNDSIPSLQVEFDYESDNNGLIVLRYENNSWGDKDIFNCIKNFEVSPKPDNIEFKRDSSQITIKTKPNLKSAIHYQIVQDYKGLPQNQLRYRPIVDSTYFHILGMRLFMVPERVFETDTSKANIKITYEKNSNTALYHSSFGKNNVQNIDVIREDLYASFFAGGDFRRYSFPLEKDTVYFVTRGNWKPFKDKDIFNILKETISAQHNFWNDPRKGNFSVSLIPTFENWYSVGGSGFSSSFISFASNNNKVTLAHMKWLYNHELLHKWIGRTILNENEVEQYWFSEGFTDYYAYKLLLKNNRLNTTEYIDILNKDVIIPHYKDPVNNTPNGALTFEEYWTNYIKYMKLPYRRGLLYAFYIDNKIKEQNHYSRSLDDVMHELFEMALQDENMRLNKTLFLRTLSKYLNDTDTASDFEKYINQGELIDFSNQLPEGLMVEDQEGIPILKIESDDLKKLGRRLKA
ncbi:M61 family metallopeptidase [Tamlana flava]|uniref:M61 family metallopeptidase n=1 Tax=Tamlana flava TaxID=3158572 RepID=UPI00351B03C2